MGMTLSQFKKYILRKLGSPVINIEISSDQLEDTINDAVQLFYESHYDGVNSGIILLPVLKGIQEYTLDNNIQDVVRALAVDDFSYSNDPLLIKESLQFGDSLGLRYDLISLEIWRQNLQNLRNMYNKEVLFQFNSSSKHFYLQMPPLENKKMALQVYQSELEIDDIYGDRWLKKYAVALAKLQWGTNVGKYTGAQMAGGAEFNHESIKSEAQTEIEKLEEQLEDRYAEPPDWRIA